MKMTQDRMDRLVGLRKDVQHAQELLEAIKNVANEFTGDDGLTAAYVEQLRLYSGSTIRSIKMLALRLEEIEGQQKGWRS